MDQGRFRSVETAGQGAAPLIGQHQVFLPRQLVPYLAVHVGGRRGIAADEKRGAVRGIVALRVQEDIALRGRPRPMLRVIAGGSAYGDGYGRGVENVHGGTGLDAGVKRRIGTAGLTFKERSSVSRPEDMASCRLAVRFSL